LRTLEVDLEVTATITPLFPLQHREPEVRPIPVNLTDGGTKVMQIGLHPSEYRVLLACLTTSLLPAQALMAERLGRDDMLPFDPLSPVLALPDLVVALFKVWNQLLTLADEAAAAVDGLGMISVEFCRDPFGLVKGAGRCSENDGGE
jgi:hypothetical protein